MLKSIDNQKSNNREMFHLRFFRIRFNNGKFVIKIDKGDKKMRSFNLTNLVGVEPAMNLIPSESNLDLQGLEERTELLSREEILEKYELDERIKINIW